MEILLIIIIMLVLVMVGFLYPKDSTPDHTPAQYIVDNGEGRVEFYDYEGGNLLRTRQTKTSTQRRKEWLSKHDDIELGE